mmetsp:Transcript_47944/g.113978  ORF Transcript_47944/g.113978 Transcript_47944/m.113978 type:complete len:780 (+) Transcript_47944:131-2470(+)|eukprot:CAMPEP_0178397572 /NCGR_PEP_ID=MMETSP0689_2-20121128/14318_1 /TAXON_ID=160604 /ORGANISM="Amphidinium massartii, Strain CS-259" /LENGTH=779 /DNA_ID=CAMNT_0020018291 /DNA_START=18 /DNA_END=2360 /DNA_ORIENTATION=+
MAAASIAELPETVERRLLTWLREPELLKVAQLGHRGLCRTAREDVIWQSHYDKRLRTKDSSSDNPELQNLTLFERLIRGRHLEAFRKPPAASHAMPVPAVVTHCLPTARSSGAELVFISLNTASRVTLHGRDGQELASELMGQDQQLLLPPAAEVPTEEPEIGSELVSALVDSEAPTPTAAAANVGKERKQKPKGKRSQGGCQSSPSFSPQAASPPSTPSLQPLALPISMEITKQGALAVDTRMPSGAGPAELLNAFRVDKWGDVYRKAFLSKLSLSAPKGAPSNVLNEGIVAPESPLGQAAEEVLCCSNFGDGAYIVAGTSTNGTYLWDVREVSGTAIQCQTEHRQAARKQGKPCLTCGQLGHWASTCPLAASSKKKKKPSRYGIERSAADEEQKPQDAVPAVFAKDIGPVTSVAGLTLAHRGLLVVCSASACRIVCDIGSAGSEIEAATNWTRIQSAEVPPHISSVMEIVHPLTSMRVYADNSDRVHCWLATEQGLLVAGALSPSSPGKEPSEKMGLDPAIKTFSHGVSATLLLQRPAGLLCGTDAGRIVHWHLGKAERSTSVGFVTSSSSTATSSSKSTVRITCLSHDPRLPIVLSGGADGSVKIWDFTSLTCIRTLPFFGQGPVACVAVLVHAPARGLVACLAGQAPRLQVAWFGENWAVKGSQGQVGEAGAAGRQYAENPGKASTCEDWRGVRPNSRKTDLGYGGGDYQHRGAQRKERRDLGARVKREVWQPTAETRGSGAYAALAQAQASGRYEQYDEYEDYDYDDYYEYEDP